MGRTSRELDVLLALLEVTLESVAGYREAAAASDSAALQREFQRRADERQRMVDRISALVERLGGQPFATGATIAQLPLSSGVVHVEEFLRSCYEDVLQDNVLSPGAYDALHAAYRSVWTGAAA